jgi:flagellar P-ring protein precursor FlgI
MTCASHTLRRVIAPAGRSGVRTLALCVLLATPAAANSRLKAIADFESVRGHFLARYGVVVGLDGTGDSLRNSAFAEESLGTMPRRLGVGMCGLDLETKKVAPAIVPAAGAPISWTVGIGSADAALRKILKAREVA